MLLSPLPDFKGQEDAAIAQSLYETMEKESEVLKKPLAQYQQLIPYANEYLRHRDDFEAFLANKNGQVQQAVAGLQCSNLHRNSLGGIRQS